MWKKEGTPDQVATPRLDAAPAPERVARRGASDERATIGRSITIRGEVSGDEDLLIQGRVDGSVNLKQHSITVGSEGEVKADITARLITVEGRVEGNLTAEEQIILRGSAVVEGDIVSPRVVLEDGARFRGGVDMGDSLQASGLTAGGSPQARGQDAHRGTTGSEHSGAHSGQQARAASGMDSGAAPSPAQVSP
jgi:cytoskeletal protein CcmA (bactofilin family)